MSEQNEQPKTGITREIVLKPILIDSSPELKRKMGILGVLTLAYITTPKLELLDMFCDLL